MTILKNDLYPTGKSVKIAIPYEKADTIFENTISLCQKVQNLCKDVKRGEDSSPSPLYLCKVNNPLKDTGKIFVMKVYGVEDKTK